MVRLGWFLVIAPVVLFSLALFQKNGGTATVLSCIGGGMLVVLFGLSLCRAASGAK